MKRLALPIVILLLVLFAGAVWALFGYLDLAQLTEKTLEQPFAAKDGQPPPQGPKQDQADAAQGGTASFDVVRIDPNGTSVFAGRAEPGAQVTITGDGKKVGTAVADENGEWTYAGEHKFANADPRLDLIVKPAAQVAEDTTTAKVAGTEQRSAPDKTAAVGERRSASTVTSDLIKNLEGMVAEARTNAVKEEPTVKAKSDLPSPNEPPQGNVTQVRLSPPQPLAQDAGDAKKTIPVPITFIFDEANFTEEGRKAAALLLEYLKLKQFKRITLTGHADERGTDELNLNLSRERLETVARYLKEGGFTGELDLVPKGEAEPFTGVVRNEYGQDDLWQLDRRVELVIAP